MTDELRPGEHLNEADLFIPCLHEDLDRIMKGNVEDSRIVLHDKPLGRGYYFTSKASLCMQWCKEHLETSQVYLIMCQVLLGTSTQGSSDLAEFPRRPDGRPYDSLVDKKSDPSVFVIKNIDQCYPAFVINFSYKTTETPSQGLFIVIYFHVIIVGVRANEIEREGKHTISCRTLSNAHNFCQVIN